MPRNPSPLSRPSLSPKPAIFFNRPFPFHIFSQKKGITLVAAIMLMTFMATAVVMTSVFVIAQIEQTRTREMSAQAIELAQAGVSRAIYDYRTREAQGIEGYFSLGQQNVDANNYFVVGGHAGDFLAVNVSGTAVAGNMISGVWAQNVTNSSIKTNWMLLTWNDPNRILNCIYYNGGRIWPTGNPSSCNGSAASGAWVNILDQTFPGGDNPKEFQFTWDGNMSATTVTATFWMTDGTFRTIQIFPATNNFSFTVRSTGKPQGAGNLYRSVRADYNILTSTIQKYDEINEAIAP